MPWLEDAVSISTVVEDLVQRGFIYHTILHGPLKKMMGSNAVLWNLPLPYRRRSRLEQKDLDRWIAELRDQPSSESIISKEMLMPWVHQQAILYFLRNGHTYLTATESLVMFWKREKEKMRRNPDGTFCYYIHLSNFWGAQATRRPSAPPSKPEEPYWVPETLKLRGEE